MGRCRQRPGRGHFQPAQPPRELEEDRVALALAEDVARALLAVAHAQLVADGLPVDHEPRALGVHLRLNTGAREVRLEGPPVGRPPSVKQRSQARREIQGAIRTAEPESHH